MTRKFRFILMGLVASAAISFAGGIMYAVYIKAVRGSYIDMSTLELVQTQEPENGYPIATIKTSLGDIKVVLYPEYAPNAVKKILQILQKVDIMTILMFLIPSRECILVREVLTKTAI